MNPKLIECIISPAKSQLLQAINYHERITAKELAQIVTQLPQATLYRYLNKMVKDGLIKVVAENQIRNVKEKVYAMAIDFEAENKKIAEDSSGESYLALFQIFTNGLHEDFKKHMSTGNAAINRKFAYAFGALPITVTDEEAEELYKKIEALLQPYHDNPMTADRYLRNFALVVTPPAEK